jgi:hypothetical protein
MKTNLFSQISGIGYAKLEEHRRKTVVTLLAACGIISVTLFLAISGIVIMRNFMEKRTMLVAAPPIKTYEPRKQEHKVKVQRRQKSSSRPQITPRMVATRLTKTALPNIPVDPKLVKTTFQPEFKAMSGMGLGAGIGTGLGLGGFGGGVSEFDFFGIRGKAEKIAILVDVSESIVEEQVGGTKGFARVKERVNQVINALSPNTMFNVIVFADAASQWEKKLVVATDVNKNAAKLWLQPFNTSDGNKGLMSGNIEPSDLGLQAAGGTTRLDLALTAAFENRADTILVVGDGAPRVAKVLSGKELAAWNKMQNDWQKQNGSAAAVEAAAAHSGGAGAIGPTRTRRERVWVTEIGRDSGRVTGGKWDWREVQEGGSTSGGNAHSRVPPRPVMPADFQWWTLADFCEHFKILHTDLYTKIGQRPPTVHCIGYMVDESGHDFLKGLAKHYNGQYRRVGKMMK